MNNKLIRRKWAFEKGRNSSSIILAAAVTAAVGALAVFGFSYAGPPSNEKRQMTRATLVPQWRNELFPNLNEYDSAHAYRINNGGYPFCLSCRRSHLPNSCGGNKFAIDLNTAVMPAIPGFSAVVTTNEYTPGIFPVSGIPAPVLPAAAELPRKNASHIVESDNGRIFTLPALDEVKIAKNMPPAVIRLIGSGLLARIEVIDSCGNKELDDTAGRILKAAGLTDGSYTVNWRKNGGEK